MFNYVRNPKLILYPPAENNVVQQRSTGGIVISLNDLPPIDYNPEDFSVNSLIAGNVQLDKTPSTHEVTLDSRDSIEKNISKVLNESFNK